MLSFGSGQRYYLWRSAVDFRKSYNGLQGLVTNEMKRPVLSGEVFIFMNRRRDQIRLLVWDRSGFVLWSKRLEQGRFELPAGSSEGGHVLAWRELLLIVEGASLQSVRWRKRLER